MIKKREVHYNCRTCSYEGRTDASSENGSLFVQCPTCKTAREIPIIDLTRSTEVTAVY